MEHYFHAMKFIEIDQFERIKNSGSPKQAKDLGQSRNTPIRDECDNVKEHVMAIGLREKFKDPELQKILLNTGKKQLIENSPYD